MATNIHHLTQVHQVHEVRMIKGLDPLTFGNGDDYFLLLPYEHLCVLGDPGPRGKTGPQAMADLWQ